LVGRTVSAPSASTPKKKFTTEARRHRENKLKKIAVAMPSPSASTPRKKFTTEARRHRENKLKKIAVAMPSPSASTPRKKFTTEARRHRENKLKKIADEAASLLPDSLPGFFSVPSATSVSTARKAGQ